MKKRINQIVIFALLIFPLASVMGQQRGNGLRADGPGREFRGGDGPGMMMAIPDLTEEQQEKIKDLHIGLMKESLQVRNQLGENRARMRTLQTAETPDMKAINKLIDESSKLEADLQKQRAANHQEVRKLLTEEQRVIFDSHSGQMRADIRRSGGQEERGMQMRQRAGQNDSDN